MTVTAHPLIFSFPQLLQVLSAHLCLCFGLSLTDLSCGGSTGSYSSQLSSWLLMESEGETVIVLCFAHMDSPTSLPGTVPNPSQRRPHEFDAGLPITSAAYFVLLLSFEWSFLYPDIALITSTAYI